jgi:hypothetical protein
LLEELDDSDFVEELELEDSDFVEELELEDSDLELLELLEFDKELELDSSPAVSTHPKVPPVVKLCIV